MAISKPPAIGCLNTVIVYILRQHSLTRTNFLKLGISLLRAIQKKWARTLLLSNGPNHSKILVFLHSSSLTTPYTILGISHIPSLNL
jgi:hypothetical protein